MKKAKYALALREELNLVDTIIASHLISLLRIGRSLEHLEASSALLCIASRGYTGSAWCQQEAWHDRTQYTSLPDNAMTARNTPRVF